MHCEWIAAVRSDHNVHKKGLTNTRLCVKREIPLEIIKRRRVLSLSTRIIEQRGGGELQLAFCTTVCFWSGERIQHWKLSPSMNIIKTWSWKGSSKASRICWSGRHSLRLEAVYGESDELEGDRLNRKNFHNQKSRRGSHDEYQKVWDRRDIRQLEPV